MGGSRELFKEDERAGKAKEQAPRKKDPSDNRSSRRTAAVVLVSLELLLLALAVVNLLYGQFAGSGLPGKKIYRIQLSGTANEDLQPLIEQYRRTRPWFKFRYSGIEPDVIIGESRKDGFTATLIEGTPRLVLKAGTRSRLLREKREYWFNCKKTGFLLKRKDMAVSVLEEYLKDYYVKQPGISMTAVGDIIPARNVARRMARHGVNYPFEAIAPHVRGADVVFGNLECPLTDRFPPPYSGMDFLAPSNTIEGIKLLGVDVVGLANNHSTNFGREAFVDTLNLLRSNGIKYAGGGMDYSEAHAPAVMDVKGLKMAFLGYNSIIGSIDATEDKPGVAWISMPPYYPVNESHVQAAERDISEAGRKADLVIACFHWSREDVYHPSEEMRSLARRACDAGADMVIGSHPHTIQPIEFYRGKVIAYSMGNFVFDQMQRDQTRDGFFMRCTFRGKLLTGLELVPYKIHDYCRPVPFKGDSGQYLLDQLFQISGWQ